MVHKFFALNAGRNPPRSDCRGNCKRKIRPRARYRRHNWAASSSMPMRCRSTAVGAFLPRALQLKKKAVHLMHYMGMWPIMKAIRLAIGCATLAQFLSGDKRPIIVGGTGSILSRSDRGARRYPPHSGQYSRPIGGPPVPGRIAADAGGFG